MSVLSNGYEEMNELSLKNKCEVIKTAERVIRCAKTI